MNRFQVMTLAAMALGFFTFASAQAQNNKPLALKVQRAEPPVFEGLFSDLGQEGKLSAETVDALKLVHQHILACAGDHLEGVPEEKRDYLIGLDPLVQSQLNHVKLAFNSPTFVQEKFEGMSVGPSNIRALKALYQKALKNPQCQPQKAPATKTNTTELPPATH